jgi:hypothetical protein
LWRSTGSAAVGTERDILKIAWEGELFGVGLFETLTEMYPEHAKELTACATLRRSRSAIAHSKAWRSGISLPTAN